MTPELRRQRTASIPRTIGHRYRSSGNQQRVSDGACNAARSENQDFSTYQIRDTAGFFESVLNGFQRAGASVFVATH